MRKNIIFKAYIINAFFLKNEFTQRHFKRGSNVFMEVIVIKNKRQVFKSNVQMLFCRWNGLNKFLNFYEWLSNYTDYRQYLNGTKFNNYLVTLFTYLSLAYPWIWASSFNGFMDNWLVNILIQNPVG